MARLTGPDDAYRTVYLRDGTARARGYPVVLWADEQLTTVADVRTLGGDPIPESTVMVDSYSRVPLILYPDGVDVVYASINGGPAIPLGARLDSRLDSIVARLDGAESGTGELVETVDALAAEVAGKQAALPSGTTSQFLRGDKTFVALGRADVGLAAVDNTSDAAKPISTATATALGGKVGKGDLTLNVKDFGAVGNNTGNDASAVQAAIDSLPTSGTFVGGNVFLPPGTYRLTSPIVLKPNVRITGAGRRASRIHATSGGLFTWTADISDVVIEHLHLSGTAGHLFAPSGGAADHGIYTCLVRDCTIVQQDTTKSIMHHVSGRDYDNVTFRECDMTRAAGATVPGFNIINSGGAANQNRWEDSWAHSQNSTGAPFFHLESTSSDNYAYDNVFRNITGEQNAGGLIRALSTHNLVIDNVTDYDVTVPYTASIIHIGKSATVGAPPSVYPTVRSSGRRDNTTLPVGIFDVNLVPNEVQRALIQNANHSSSKLKLNFGATNIATILNAFADSWPGQPTDALHYYSHPAQFSRGLYVGASKVQSGTGSPEGVVTGSIGDRYLRTDGTRATALYVKESGTGNTGWSAHSPVPQPALVAGGRRLLSGSPSPMAISTATWAKDNWRFMPLTLTRPLALTHLGVLATTAASGGTATLIFALYAVDSVGKPAARQADYSTYGSIDLTTGSGTEAILPTGGLIIPEGEWMIGCAWTGTATTPPVLYSTSGAHPAVAGTAIVQQASAYQQSVSGASSPTPAVPTGAATAGIAVYGATA